MYPDLRVETGGLKLKNPVILASGPFGYNIKGLKRFASEGFSAVTSKTLTPVPWAGNPPPRSVSVKPYYLFNSDGLRNPGYENFCDELSTWDVDDVPVIVSITAGSIEEWVEGARMMEEAGAAAVQLNTACGHIPDETCWGAYWSADPGRFTDMVRSVKRAVKIPVWVKTTNAELAEKAGADADVIGGFYSGVVIDLKTGKPRIGTLEHSATVTGPPAKPVGLRSVALSAKKVGIPLIGSGGVSTGYDAIEYIMVGASAVELYTAAYWEGPGVVKKILEQIESFMVGEGIRSLDEIKGKSLQFL